jgi:triosephosphate isomerase
MMNYRLKVRLCLVNVFRVIVALTMIASGLLKLLDPLGMVYKLQSYTHYLDINVDALWMKVIAVALGVVELQLGVYLLLGIRRRTSAWITFLLVLVFLNITGYFYFNGEVNDCGCFGAAFELSQGETVVKNLIFVIMLAYMVRFPHKMRRLVTERNQVVATVYVFCYGIVLALYSLHYLPLVTFTDYRVGEDWGRQYQYGDMPARDGILNLGFYTSDGDDVTSSVLNDSTTTILVTLPDAKSADDSSADRINDIYDWAIDHECCIFALVGSDTDYQDWKDRTGASYASLSVDPDVIKNMVRSSPGMLLIDKGVLKGKWGTNNLPTKVDVASLVSGETPPNYSENMTWVRILLLLIAPLLLLVILDGLWLGRKYHGHRIRMVEILKKREEEKVAGGE